MESIKEIGDRLWTEEYGPNGKNSYSRKGDVVAHIKEEAKCSLQQAKREYDRQVLLQELYDADNVNDLKDILEKVINHLY